MSYNLNKLYNIKNNVITLKSPHPKRTEFLTGLLAILYLAIIQVPILIFEYKSILRNGDWLTLLILLLPTILVLYTCLRTSYITIDLNKKTLNIPNELTNKGTYDLNSINCLFATEFINYVQYRFKNSDKIHSEPERHYKIFLCVDSIKESVCIFSINKPLNVFGNGITIEVLNELVKILAKKIGCDYIENKANIQLSLVFDKSRQNYEIVEKKIDSKIPQLSYNQNQTLVVILLTVSAIMPIILVFVIIYIANNQDVINAIGK